MRNDKYRGSNDGFRRNTELAPERGRKVSGMSVAGPVGSLLNGVALLQVMPGQVQPALPQVPEHRQPVSRTELTT